NGQVSKCSASAAVIPFSSTPMEESHPYRCIPVRRSGQVSCAPSFATSNWTLKSSANSFSHGTVANREAKPRRADDTARVTVWERRSPPGLFYRRPRSSDRGLFLLRVVSCDQFLSFVISFFQGRHESQKKIYRADRAR